MFDNIHDNLLNMCLVSDEILILFIIILLIVDLTLDYKYKNSVGYIKFNIIRTISLVLVVILDLMILLLFDLRHYPSNQHYFFNNQFVFNYGILHLKIIILVILILILLSMYDNIGHEKIVCPETMILLLISVFGMFIILSSNDLFITGLGLELQTMPFFILACLKRTSNLSVEAGLKYFTYASFCSAISFFGISLIYGFLGTTNFSEIRNILNVDVFSDFYSIYISLCFILIGLFFKLGIIPFHFWIADIYQGCPNIITYFFAVLSKFSIVFIIFRLYYDVFIHFLDYFLIIFLLFGVISIIIGSILALYQVNFKRFLAYSAVVHMGHILLFFGMSTFEGVEYAFCYLIIYMLTSINVFNLFLSINRSDKSSIQNIVDFIIIIKSNHFLSLAFVISILSLGGIPPFAGFFAKLPVYLLLVKTVNPFLGILIILSSALSAVYYIRIIRMCWYNEAVGKNPTASLSPLTYKQVIMISTIVFINVFFIFFEDPLLSYIHYIVMALWI